MKIDEKYFGVFLAIVALIAAFFIAYFSFTNRTGDQISFEEAMFEQDSLRTVFWPSIEANDSVQVADFQGQFVVLDFWANWTDISQRSHQALATLESEYPDTLQVIAASVGLEEQEVLRYMQDNNLPFYFAEGSEHFLGFHVPGLPAQLIYEPGGDLQSVFLGYPDSSQYDSLRSMINDDGI